MDFNGKVAIITGGAQGIGKAICSAFLNLGMKVLVCDIHEHSEKFLEELLETFKSNVIFQKCDVSYYAELKDAFEKAKSTFGNIDIVINNAGIFNEVEWRKTIDVNLAGVINGVHLAFEFMGIHNGGSGGFVINTASMAGLVCHPLGPIYATTKHGVVGLTRSYGHQHHFDKTGVRVNAICPSRVDTDFARDYFCKSGDETKWREMMKQRNAMTTDDVVKAVLKLLNDQKNGALVKISKNKDMEYVD